VKYCPKCASKLEDRLVDGLERKACSSPECDFVHWDNPLPVVAALIQYKDNIILARNAKWPEGMFSLITGFLEKRETPEQAVLREAKEELGLDGEIKGFIGHYPFFAMNQIILAFWMSAKGELKTGEEIAEVKLVSKGELDPSRFGRLVLTSAIVRDWLEQQR